MAKLRGGILGTIAGKVAGVVGAQWKNVNYVRQYAIPANPNSAAQQTQRNKFKDVVAFAKLILGEILNVYVDPFLKNMSGYNWFIKKNIAIFDGSPVFSAVYLTDGKLYLADISAEPTYTTDHFTITFGTGTGSNGASDDQVFACIYDETTEVMKFASATVDRSTGTIDVPWASAPAGLKAAWIIASQADTAGALTMVSASKEYGWTYTP